MMALCRVWGPARRTFPPYLEGADRLSRFAPSSFVAIRELVHTGHQRPQACPMADVAVP